MEEDYRNENVFSLLTIQIRPRLCETTVAAHFQCLIQQEIETLRGTANIGAIIAPVCGRIETIVGRTGECRLPWATMVSRHKAPTTSA
jgi:hypothetical protein